MDIEVSVDTEPRIGEVQHKAEPPKREAYERPTIEKFPALDNVTFGTNINPTAACCLVGP